MHARLLPDRRSLTALLPLLASLAVFARCAFPDDAVYACEPGDVCSQQDEAGRAYVCRGGYCFPPSTDAGADAGTDAGDGGGTAPDPEDAGTDAGTDAGIGFEALPFTGPQCALGFCFENPAGGGSTLRAVAARSADEVFLVGEQGTVLFWDGATLRRVALTDEDLHAVWADARRVVIGGARGTLLEWGLGGFGPQLQTQTASVSALAGWGDYGFAGTHLQTLFERSGGAWTQTGTTNMAVHSAWSADAGVTFFVNRLNGEVHVLEGATERTVVGAGPGLYGVDGTAGRAIAVGEGGRRLDWDGGEWSESFLAVGERMLSVKVFPQTAFATLEDGGVLLRLTASGATGVPSGTDQILRAIGGATPDDLWAVGEHGAVVHGVAGTFAAPAGFLTPDFVDVWVDPADRAWAISDAGLFAANPESGYWEQQPLSAAYPHATALFVNTTGYWIGLADGHAVKHDADFGNPRAAWDGGFDRAVLDIWGDSALRYAVAEDTVILRSPDGVKLELMPHGCGKVLALGGTSTANLWVVGEGGTACRLESGSWQPHPLDASVGAVVAVWSDAWDYAVAITRGGYVALWDGESWTETLVDASASFRALAGRSRTDLHAFGDSGRVLDLGAFPNLADQALHLPGRPHLRAAASGDAGIYVVGEDGAILRRGR